VWLYHRFSLSFRDVEDLLAERGITVSYEAIRQWCLKSATIPFGPRRCGQSVSGRAPSAAWRPLSNVSLPSVRCLAAGLVRLIEAAAALFDDGFTSTALT
jgi:hypothetical protein